MQLRDDQNMASLNLTCHKHRRDASEAGVDPGGGGGGHGGPMPPPFGTEPERNAEVYHALSACIATLMQCFVSCIHRALRSAVPKLKRQFCGSASNTKADSEGKGLRETTLRRIA